MKIVEFEGKELELLKNKSLPKLMNKLENIIRRIGLKVGFDDRLKTIGFCFSKKINDYRIYLGIDYDIWEKKNLPVSIFIQNYEKVYLDFDLNINGIVLEKIKWDESTVSNLEYGYVVILEEQIGNPDFELKIENTIKYLIKELRD